MPLFLRRTYLILWLNIACLGWTERVVEIYSWAWLHICIKGKPNEKLILDHKSRVTESLKSSEMYCHRGAIISTRMLYSDYPFIWPLAISYTPFYPTTSHVKSWTRLRKNMLMISYLSAVGITCMDAWSEYGARWEGRKWFRVPWMLIVNHDDESLNRGGYDQSNENGLWRKKEG